MIFHTTHAVRCRYINIKTISALIIVDYDEILLKRVK